MTKKRRSLSLIPNTEDLYDYNLISDLRNDCYRLFCNPKETFYVSRINYEEDPLLHMFFNETGHIESDDSFAYSSMFDHIYLRLNLRGLFLGYMIKEEGYEEP